MFRFTIRDVLSRLQPAVEAATSTILGAFVLYWFAPIVSYRRGFVPEVEALKFMVLGAIAGAFGYFCLRVIRLADSN